MQSTLLYTARKGEEEEGYIVRVSFQSLAGGDLRSRNRVAVEVVVDVGSVARVGRLNVSRNLCSGREGLASATSDLQVN